MNCVPTLSTRLKQQAHHLGFPLVGIASADTPARYDRFLQWLDSGYAGRMRYLERRRDAYHHPSSVLKECRSLLMLGAPYLSSEEQRHGTPLSPGAGRVARYAQSSEDYHHVIRRRLKQLRKWLLQQAPTAKVRGVVDTAPLLERDFAQQAGLGWIGKNTLLLNKRWGSYFFLAALLTDLELEPDSPHPSDHCGSCTACLDHCPTQAFPQPYVLDATRCISYLTIEQREAVDPGLASRIDGWIFGCDICQEVCPWNRRSLLSNDPAWQPESSMALVEVLEILQMDTEQFQVRFQNTPLARPGLIGMKRNAILVAGWQRWTETVQPLLALLACQDEVLRTTAAWALGRIGGPHAACALAAALEHESSQAARDAISQALSGLHGHKEAAPAQDSSVNKLPNWKLA